MINIENIIKCHNSKTIKIKVVQKVKLKKKHKFPFKNNECRKENVIYEAKIEHNNDSKVYIGLTENEIKKKNRSA